MRHLGLSGSVRWRTMTVGTVTFCICGYRNCKGPAVLIECSNSMGPGEICPRVLNELVGVMEGPLLIIY